MGLPPMQHAESAEVSPTEVFTSASGADTLQKN